MDPSALDQFPARKALLDQYLPKDFQMNVDDAYNLFCDIIKSRFGREGEDLYNQRLDGILSGDTQVFIDSPDLDYIMSQYSLEELQEYDRKVRK